MKTQLGFLFVILLSSVASCNKTDSANTSLNGSYKIASLVIGNVDKTALVSGYTISLDNNGMMSVHDSMNTYNCNWSDNSGMMMNGMHDYHFDMMGCPDDSPMKYLDADWVMDSQSDTMCSFHQNDSINNILSLHRL